MLATTQSAPHLDSPPAAASIPFVPSFVRYSSRPTFCALPPRDSPRRMHEYPGDKCPTSPYASMAIPFFDRSEASALSEIAGREYRSLAESVSIYGLVVRLREHDRAALNKVKGASEQAKVAQPQKT